jgi:hypothetical protein
MVFLRDNKDVRGTRGCEPRPAGEEKKIKGRKEGRKEGHRVLSNAAQQ